MNDTIRCLMFLLTLLLFGCAGNPPQTTIGSAGWVIEKSTDPKFSTVYTVHTIDACTVSVLADGSGVQLQAKHVYHPRGIITYIVDITRDENGKFEVGHGYMTLFRKGSDEVYPWFDFSYEPYDIFYSNCFLAAEQLPEEVQVFLKKYSVHSYKEEEDKKPKPKIERT